MTSSESVGFGGRPRRLVCVFLLVCLFVCVCVCVFFFFFFLCVSSGVFAALDRPLLNSVWQERISRILDIEDRRYNIFIEPDPLATFSLGPVPSSSVKALVRANKKREFSRQYMGMVLSYSFIAFFDLCASFVRRYQYDEAEQNSVEADGAVRGGGDCPYQLEAQEARRGVFEAC